MFYKKTKFRLRGPRKTQKNRITRKVLASRHAAKTFPEIVFCLVFLGSLKRNLCFFAEKMRPLKQNL